MTNISRVIKIMMMIHDHCHYHDPDYGERHCHLHGHDYEHNRTHQYHVNHINNVNNFSQILAAVEG